MNKKVILLLAILTIPQITAFGVVTPYFEGNELQMYPGEKTTINLTLQNMVGNQDHTFKAEIPEQYQEYIELVNENPTYFVPLGWKNVTVPLEIHIPRNTELGEYEEIEITFTQADTNNQGTITFGASFNTKVPLEIVNKKESTFYDPNQQNILDKALLIAAWGLIILIIIDMTRRAHRYHKKRKHKKKQHQKTSRHKHHGTH